MDSSAKHLRLGVDYIKITDVGIAGIYGLLHETLGTSRLLMDNWPF
jgi:NCAIR mutase (PurE)-related protein